MKNALVLDMIQKLGLTAVPQAAFFKVSVGGKKTVYVSKTENVTRVDLSGFCLDHPAITPISEEQAKERKLGKVRGQVDFKRPEEEVVSALSAALGEVQFEGLMVTRLPLIKARVAHRKMVAADSELLAMA